MTETVLLLLPKKDDIMYMLSSSDPYEQSDREGGVSFGIFDQFCSECRRKCDSSSYFQMAGQAQIKP